MTKPLWIAAGDVALRQSRKERLQKSCVATAQWLQRRWQMPASFDACDVVGQDQLGIVGYYEHAL